MLTYFPAIATLAAALFGGYLLVRVHRRNAQRVAAVKFRASFALALGQIEAASRHRDGDPIKPDISRILTEAFPAHAAAVEEYRPFVSPRDRRAYEQAWHQYRELAYDGDGIGAVFLAEGRNSDAPLSAIRNRILTIVRFTDA